MKIGLLLILSTSYFSNCNCTILAAAGYVASSNPVRNALISSGLGNVIKSSADSFYEKSGFRYSGDQGTSVRKAVMIRHDIVEVDVNDPLKRNETESTTRLDYLEESRMYSERLFGVLNQMDKNTCISRLLCEIGAQPSAFGILGLKINHYIQSVPPVTWNSATFPYTEAFQAGIAKGKVVCLHHYLTCTYDLNRVIEFLWHFISPIHS